MLWVGSPAGTMIQTVRGGSSFETSSSSDDAPLAPWPSAVSIASCMVVEHHALVLRVALDPMHHVGAHLSEPHEPELHQISLLTASGPSISILATPTP